MQGTTQKGTLGGGVRESEAPIRYEPFCTIRYISKKHTRIVCRVNNEDIATKAQLVIHTLLEQLNYDIVGGGVGHSAWVSNKGRGTRMIDVIIDGENNLVIEIQDFSRRGEK